MREPPAPPAADPSERTARLQLLDDLIKKLSPKKRLVLVLFEIEELPVDEIAKIAGCPENTVWSRLHHARAELTEMAKRRMR
jgi:RNA polymerase sigma-70 factor (ECF subfamily)